MRYCHKVVKIADGDTLTILDASNDQHRIRLPASTRRSVSHSSPGHPHRNGIASLMEEKGRRSRVG
jgi:protein required for attachment to host cells